MTAIQQLTGALNYKSLPVSGLSRVKICTKFNSYNIESH